MSEKLEQIESGFEFLRDAAKRNEHLTKNLTGILEEFQDRVGRLQETILPVYQQTEALRLKQQNLEKTLKLVDEVVNFYSVSKEVDVIIQNGPSGGNLDTFLQAMETIENAVKYFEKNNSQSVELENLLSLFNTGSDALSKEFRDMLTRHSKVLNAVAILEMIEEDYSSQQNSSTSMPEHVQGDLKKIAEWLMYHNVDTYMNIYASLRSNALQKSLQGLKDYQKSSSLTMATTGSAVASPSSPVMRRSGKFDTPSSAGKGRRIQSAFKMLKKATTDHSRGYGYGLGSKKFENKEDTVSDRESENFLILTTAMLKLMQIESQLMLGIIPMQHRNKIFEIISRDSFDLLFADGENIASRIKKSISRQEFSAILTLFPIIKCLQTLQPSFDEIFVGSLQTAKANKLTILLKTFQTNGMRALEEFIENVRNEQASQLPKDGTVHELTSNVLMFLEHLTDYMDTVANVLAQDPTYSLTPSPSNKVLDEKTKRGLLGAYMKRVLQQLNLTLVTCSDLYYDHSIKAVFRLNNACYILKCLQGSILLDLLKTKEPDCQQNYIEMMEDQRKAYLIATWKKVDYSSKLFGADDIPVAVLQAGKLRDKDRQIIKDKFSAFNREMDEISRLQQGYSVPDPELRTQLQKASRDYIIPKYKEFFDKYSNVPFTKNTEKYVRFTPMSVADNIDTFFLQNC
ncbi:exocyst complex component 7 [Folsomia candida]|uniref:Exocyst complex component 7 n=1 Tax=Folsomia candida TaxID=158441 RepID=A0A226DDK3_FOLCA|nr:exocyst complex component 7 [Folsomia candida]OXA43675.1 Exocyst complex component 7 [Folsomia candida]